VEAECFSKASEQTHYTRWCKTTKDPSFCTIPNKINARYWYTSWQGTC